MKQTTDLERRAFLRGKSPRQDPNTIRPPWAIEASIFIDKCTRCDECIKACPEKIISRGDGGYPEINFQQGECTFCMKCVESCEADAFIKLPIDKEIDLIIKTIKPWNLNVSFNNTCLSMNAVVCRACADNCDEQSIHFKLKIGGVSEPQFTQNTCTGCGACLSVCPVHAVHIEPVIDQNQS